MHSYRHPERGYLLTEIDTVLRIDERGEVQARYYDPFLGFLHTVNRTEDGRHALAPTARMLCSIRFTGCGTPTLWKKYWRIRCDTLFAS